MNLGSVVRLAAEKLRKKRVLTLSEVNLLKAAIGLRKAKGLFRQSFTPDEVEIIARARRLAHEAGQVRLSRYLVLLTRQRTRYAVLVGKIHECPKCGKLHTETRWHMTRKELLKEAHAILRAAGLLRGHR